MAIQTADFNINDGSGGSLDGLIEYDDANGNQITHVTWSNTTPTDWVLTILSGANPPLKATIRKNRSGEITSAAVLAGYVGDPLLIEIGTK